MTIAIFSSGSSDNGLRSLDFESGSSQYLSMSNGNWGSYNRSKFGIVAGINIESRSGSGNVIFAKSDDSFTAAGAEFQLYLDGSGRIELITNHSGSTQQITTNGSYSTGSGWLQIYATYDTGASPVFSLYVNGAQPATTINSSGLGAVTTSTSNITIGCRGAAVQLFDGQIYQPALFSGTLPGISDIWDSANARPKDLRGLSGLYSLLYTTIPSTLEDDYVLSANWTNNGGVSKSTEVP